VLASTNLTVMVMTFTTRPTSKTMCFPAGENPARIGMMPDSWIESAFAFGTKLMLFTLE